MALGTLRFRDLLTNLSHSVRKDAGTLLSRIGHFTARERRAFITEAWPELLRPYIDAAGELTTEWYDGQPSTNTVFVPQPADPPPDEQLGANGRWAIGQDDPHDALGGAGERAVFNASRDTVLDNVIREDGARWVREAQPGACSFCKLMTTRGAVYYTEQSALTVVGRTIRGSQIRPGETRIGGEDGFRGALRGTRNYGESYHDDCRCLAVMIRPGDTYQPPEYAQGWNQDYIDATSDAEKWLRNQGIDRKPTFNDILNAMDRAERARNGAKSRNPSSASRPVQPTVTKPKPKVSTSDDSEFAKHQVELLTANLKKLRDQGVPEHDKRIKFYQRQIARYTKKS